MSRFEQNPRSNDDMFEVAERFFARQMSGELSPNEAAEFASWLRQGRNHAAFEEVRRAATAADRFEDRLLSDMYAAELEEEAMRYAPPKIARTHLWRWGGLATASAAFAGLFAVMLAPQSVTMVTYQTGVGDIETFTLEDGSQMLLSSRSQASVRFDEDRRVVSLDKGEAFFEVTEDTSRPFTVTSPHGEITVVGTSFDVKLRPGLTELAVVSGVVKVADADGDEGTLTAGQAITFDDDAGLTDVVSFDPSTRLAWQTGRLKFEDAPLGTVVEELNRHRAVPLVLAAGLADERRLSGEFTIADAEGALASLTAAMQLDAVQRETSILLVPR
ncbi:MAG: FecR domain-containing protein [Parvularcula sp.]|jgi:transmembrane sensor|nr:FecR domain-containing protein [Parvularcula sp.]